MGAVDHDRAEEKRQQHACVFSRTKSGGTEVSLGGESWTMGAAERSRTFVEIDEAGHLRLQGWSVETTLDVEELVIDGLTFKLRTVDGETKSLDMRRLARRPDKETA